MENIDPGFLAWLEQKEQQRQDEQFQRQQIQLEIPAYPPPPIAGHGDRDDKSNNRGVVVIDLM